MSNEDEVNRLKEIIAPSGNFIVNGREVGVGVNDNYQPEDELAAPRGIVNGVILGAILWSLIGLLIWTFWR